MSNPYPPQYPPDQTAANQYPPTPPSANWYPANQNPPSSPSYQYPPAASQANPYTSAGYQPQANLAQHAAPFAPATSPNPRPLQPTRLTPVSTTNTSQSAFSFTTWLVIFGVTILGVAAAALIVPGMAASLTSSEGEGYWYLSRASGFVAYILLWLSMVFGLIITDRFARLWPGGPAAYDLHQYFSLIGIAFTAFHIFILLGSKYTDYSLMQLLVPFAGTQYRPLWVGLGQYSFYLSLIVTITFYARSWFGPRGWRVLHYLSFGFFLLALLHSVYSGSDSGAAWAVTLYWTTGIITLFLTIYRIANALMKPAPKRRAHTSRVTTD